MYVCIRRRPLTLGAMHKFTS